MCLDWLLMKLALRGMPTLKSGESGVYARINSIKLRVAIIPSKFHADIWESQYNGKIKVKVNTLAFLGLKIYLFPLGLTGIWRRKMDCLDKKKSRRIIIAETALTTLTANELRLQLIWKMLRHSKKVTFLAASYRSLRYNTDLPPPSHSKLFIQFFSMALYC